MDWSELAGAGLARQFPPAGRDGELRARTIEDVVAVIAAIGPIQSQTARSPFVALAARLPGVRHETLCAAYESHRIVRGSTIRGTVHTAVPEQHRVIDAVTRLGQRAFFARTLRLQERTLEEVWAALERFAAEQWRTPAELHTELRAWLAEHDPEAEPRLGDQAGRYFAFGHGGLIRRPLAGSWSGQGSPGYRSAAAVLGDQADRERFYADPDAAVDAAVELHLRAHGPSSRQDIAWWSGLGLRAIDAALGRVGAGLGAHEGPDARRYHDLDPPPAAIELPGVRLLTEFDALLCGYDPPARERFVDAEHYRVLWSQDNGLLLAPLLRDGRLTGYWRLSGSGARRALDVHFFARTGQPTKAELAAPVAALERALDVRIDPVTVARH